MRFSLNKGENMIQAEQVFGRYLNAKNLKLTEERKVVLRELFSHPGHLEAEELSYSLRKKKKRASRATIYRTLDLLVESGVARKVDLGHGHSHYELVLDHPHHEHMICLVCGRVIEFSDKSIEKMLERLCKRRGFEQAHHRIQVFGYCSKCKSNK
jgi:Fur family ferric uptake transcriptional regulator